MVYAGPETTQRTPHPPSCLGHPLPKGEGWILGFFPLPWGGGWILRFFPSPSGRGWTAAGALISRRGPGEGLGADPRNVTLVFGFTLAPCRRQSLRPSLLMRQERIHL